MGAPAARMGDYHVCPAFTGPLPHAGGTIVLGHPLVITGGQQQSRRTDLALCVLGPMSAVTLGSFSVLVGGQPAARLGDMTAHGGTIIMGDPTVLIGDTPAPTHGAGTKYPTQEAAAKAALDEANRQSIKANREMGGVIYKNPDGTYSYTGPNPGSEAGYNPTQAQQQPPDDTQKVGDYHTHGDYGQKGDVRTSDPNRDQFNSDDFSSTDRREIGKDAKVDPNYRGYVGTPSGAYKEYNPSTGTTRRFN
jgi:uncharacterized Zn-binding protein involved in type VI secretion